MTDIHAMQRAMRAKRQMALERGLIAAIDIGTFKVSCLILRFEPCDPTRLDDSVGGLAGHAAFRVIGAATTRARGIAHGEIHALPEAERAVRTVVQAAQRMAGQRVDHAIVTLSGGRPRSYGLAGEADILGETVEECDIARVLAATDMPDIGRGREIMHAQPVNFAVDHRSGLTDPRGQIGDRLAVDMHMLTIDAGVVETVVHCIRRADLELAGIASAAYAAGRAALVEDEQELGAACIDMGAGTTGIAVFLRRHMIYADSVRLGGAHITRDISAAFGIPLAQAERIKVLHGGLVATRMDDREIIELPADTGDWTHDRREITRGELIAVIRPRVEEILEDVRARLDAAGFDHLPSRRVVLTGGTSGMPGMDDVAGRLLGEQVRLGRPMRIRGLPAAATGPDFSAAVGLCLHAAHPQDEWWDFSHAVDTGPARSIRRALRWFRQNW